MDKLRSMEVFLAAVDTGSFTAAAQRYGISAVMVGKHVRELEQLLGASLLHRTTRRQSLTEIGRQYAEQCRAILAAIASAETVAETMRAAPRGLLRVTAPTTVGTDLLSPMTAEYLRQHKEVSVELSLNDRVVDLVEEGYDLALRVGVLDDSTMIARPLKPFVLCVCASPDYLAEHGVPRSPADLAQHECLDYLGWLPQHRWPLKGLREPRHTPLGRLRSNSNPALRQAALAGFGLVMQAEITLQEYLDSGRLVRVLEDFLPPPLPMQLVYSRDRRPTPKLTSFVDFVLERFGAG